MAIARPDLKAEAAVEFGLRGKIAGGNDEVVDGARHGPLPFQNRTAGPLDLSADSRRRL
jgi:hypothetical protein